MKNKFLKWWYSGVFTNAVVRFVLLLVNFQFVFWMLNLRDTLMLAVAFIAASIFIWQLVDLFRIGTYNEKA